MSLETERLQLFEYDPVADAKSTYNITNALNNNFNKIDANTLQLDQISNCILEVPQRIKYTLEDNVLTIKEGSVFIFPYGKLDVSSNLAIGDNFLNSNYKIVDYQYTDGNFYVWAELQNDVVNNIGWGTAESALMCAYPDGTVAAVALNRYTSGTTAPNSNLYSIWYDTNSNTVKQYSSGSLASSTLSFPFLQCELNGNNTVSDVSEITSLFNGVGFIGNVIYSDKGIKGLISSGKDDKGRLISTPFATDKILLYTNIEKRDNTNIEYNYTNNSLQTHLLDYIYSIDNNKIGTGNHIVIASGLKTEKDSPYKTTQLFPRKSVKFVEEQDIDGVYIRSNLTLVSNKTWYEDNQSYIYDLSNYLPKDNNKYVVTLRAHGQTGTSSGNKVNIYAKTDLMNNNYSYGLGCTATRNSGFVNVGNVNVDVVVGTGRYVQIIVTAGHCYESSLFAMGYRKIR